MRQWHSDLQQIWLEHIPRKDAESILKAWTKKTRIRRMDECFKTWVFANTKNQITATVSFEGLQVPPIFPTSAKQQLSKLLCLQRSLQPSGKESQAGVLSFRQVMQ